MPTPPQEATPPVADQEVVSLTRGGKDRDDVRLKRRKRGGWQDLISIEPELLRTTIAARLPNASVDCLIWQGHPDLFVWTDQARANLAGSSTGAGQIGIVGLFPGP